MKWAAEKTCMNVLEGKVVVNLKNEAVVSPRNARAAGYRAVTTWWLHSHLTFIKTNCLISIFSKFSICLCF